MITYQREALENVLDEMKPMLEAHWRELTYSPDAPLNVHYELYRNADANNGLMIFTARDDGKMIGYSAAFIHQGVHCTDQWQATQDVFYVKPEYRGGMIGTRLIRLAEEHFAAAGVHLAFNHTNLKDMKLGHLLEFLGYEPISIIYQKRISKCHQQS